MSLVLTKLNFGPVFPGFISTLYASVFCKVNNNGYLTEKIFIAFLSAAECLGNIVRQHPRITGLHIPGCPEQLKISQYADDTTIFVRDETSVDEVLDTISKYERGSGSKINFSPGFKIYMGQTYRETQLAPHSMV
eukprot:gene16331-17969_t